MKNTAKQMNIHTVQLIKTKIFTQITYEYDLKIYLRCWRKREIYNSIWERERERVCFVSWLDRSFVRSLALTRKRSDLSAGFCNT